MRDHTPIRVSQFGGLYNNGEDKVVPLDHMKVCRNMQFDTRRVFSRYGIGEFQGTVGKIYRALACNIGGVQRVLFLADDGGGNIGVYDTENLPDPIIDFGSGSDVVDITIVPMFDRVYISPHDGVTGIDGGFTYVYFGTDTARIAGHSGIVFANFSMTAANSATAGTVAAGTHIFGVLFETDSGYLTKFGDTVSLVATGGFKVDLASIVTGGAGTGVVKRHIVATKVITVSGSFADQAFYFVPNGTINDNSTTTITIDFADIDLQESADYLNDQIGNLPSVASLNNYQGSLVLAGPFDNPSTVYVSTQGEPERVDEAADAIAVNPGDSSSGVKNAWVNVESLIFSKSDKTYFTIRTDQAPSLWKVLELDMSIGAEPHTVARMREYGESKQDVSLIADRSGIHVFSGRFSQENLTDKIQTEWDALDQDEFKAAQFVVDPATKRLWFVGLRTDNSSIIFHGDFNEGLDRSSIKWSIWDFDNPSGGVGGFEKTVTTITLDIDDTTKKATLRLGMEDFSIYTYVEGQVDDIEFGDVASPIIGTIAFADMPHEADDQFESGIYHFAGYMLSIRGNGDVHTIISDSNDASLLQLVLPTIQMVDTVKYNKRAITNFVAEQAYWFFGTDGLTEGSWFSISKAEFYVSKLWDERPV